MIHTWQQLTYIHGLGAELPSHVFNPDKQVYHSPKGREEIFLTQFASGLRRLAFFVSCSRVSFCFVFARCCSVVLSARLSAIVCIVLSKVVGKSRLSLSSRCCILSL